MLQIMHRSILQCCSNGQEMCLKKMQKIFFVCIWLSLSIGGDEDLISEVEGKCI